MFSPAIFYAQVRAPLIAQFREDLSLRSHGIVVTTSKDATFKQAVVSILGQVNVDTLGPILPNTLIITNASNQPITHVTVRFTRMRGAVPIPMDVSFDNTTLAQATPPNGQILVLPNRILNDMKQSEAVSAAVSKAASDKTIFDPNVFSSAYVFIDSVEFADGKVVGPDTLGYIEDQKAKAEVLQEIRDKAYDSSINDAEFKSLLEEGSKQENWLFAGGPYGASIDHKLMWTQKWSRMMLNGLQNSGREYVLVMSDRLLTYQNRVVRVKEN